MVVTGSSRGIGAATARLGAANGYAICVNYRHNAAAARAVVESIAHDGGEAIAVAADVGFEVEVVRPGVIDTEIHASGGEPGRVERVKSAVPMQRGGEADSQKGSTAVLN